MPFVASATRNAPLAPAARHLSRKTFSLIPLITRGARVPVLPPSNLPSFPDDFENSRTQPLSSRLAPTFPLPLRDSIFENRFTTLEEDGNTRTPFRGDRAGR